MKKISMSQYLGTINAVLDSTQKMSSKMDPYFKIFRNALNNNEQIESADYADTKEKFAEGIKQYEENLSKLTQAKPPVKIIGIHKMFVSHYREFVNACIEMNKSIDFENESVNKTEFDNAEQLQGQAMDKINSNVQKIVQNLRLA